MNRTIGSIALAMVVSCTPATPAADEGAAAKPSDEPDVCFPLPNTEVCDNAGSGQFLKTTADHEMIAPACVWRTREVMLSADRALLFREQDCTKAGLPDHTYAFEPRDEGGRVIFGLDISADTPMPILELFPLTAGQAAKDAALATLAQAPADEQAGCEIHATADQKFVGETFLLEPSAERMAELDKIHKGEIYESCGPYGFADSQLVWEGRPNIAFFHSLGQDTTFWDPASFTFYTRQPDGKWAREG